MTTLSRNQWKLVRYQGNLLVTSVPGAGKTRIVQAKALQEAATFVEAGKRIACLTYTNAGADELERRIVPALHEDAREVVFIGTIHSFCIREILAPHAGRLHELSAGHSVATPEHPAVERLIVELLGHEPSSDDLRLFGEVRRAADGAPEPHESLRSEEIELYWAGMLQLGLIDFSGVLYYSAMLLDRYPDVAASVCGSFGWIIVDEFQDTSSAQVRILRLLSEHAISKWLLIGDFNQSIFSFNGVNRQELIDFATSLGASSVSLKTTYRCPPAVVFQANNLIGVPRMQPHNPLPVGEVFNFAGGIVASVRAFVQLLADRIIRPGDCAIIAPFKTSLLQAQRTLSALREPIRWSAQFRFTGRSAITDAASAVLAYVLHEHEVHLSDAAHRLTTIGDGLTLPLSDDDAVRVVLRAVDRVRNVGIAAVTIYHITKILRDELKRVLTRFVWNQIDELFAAALRPSVLKSSPITAWDGADIGRVLCSHDAITLATIHGAKGLQFAAVLFLGFEEGAVPFADATDFDEEVRKAYVTVTRAERLLMYGYRSGRESSLWRQANGFAQL